jgi:hypothetical protein
MFGSLSMDGHYMNKEKTAKINFHLKKKAKFVKCSTPKLVLPQVVA